MIRIAFLIIWFSCLFFTSAIADNGIEYIPEGFGAITQGGEGGWIITVTNLADSGPGSLREALSSREARIIQFGVDGTIELGSRIRVSSGNVTIDGSTAPGDGITLLNHGIQFVGDCDDIIIRHIRIRVLTGGESGDCLLFWGTDGGAVERVVVDHCSLMWATDEVVNTWGKTRDITFQWTIIAEGQSEADHPKGFHSMGWLSGDQSDGITIHHCLFAHNGDRNPKIQGGLYDLVNNVIYNWSNHNATKIGGGARANVVNNYYIPGPQSSNTTAFILPEDPDKGTKVYAKGNISHLTPTGKEDQWVNVIWYEPISQGWATHYPAPETFQAKEGFVIPSSASVTTHSAQEAYESVLANAGAKIRDDDDLRVIDEVRNRIGKVGRGNAE
jgi:pectate lyase